MYAGQQTAEKISRDMANKAAQLLKQTPIDRITELIRLSVGMTGRFGFDPRSSGNALDTGYSPNDLKLPIATFPFAELLTAIAAQYFFPQRTQQGKGITSSRGWIANDAFRYALWTLRLPVTLARMAAIGAGINTDDVIPLRAERANRDKYSNFRMATRTTWVPSKEPSKY
jgi:CRISPR-associated protein Csb3